MSVTQLSATLSAVEDDSGALIRARRKKLGMTIGALAERAQVHRDTLSAIERGGSDPQTSTAGRIERALDELEHEMGMDLPSVVGPIGDPEEGLVEFTVEGHFGVRAVVKGPIRDIDKLQAAVSRLMAGMDRPQESGGQDSSSST